MIGVFVQLLIEAKRFDHSVMKGIKKCTPWILLCVWICLTTSGLFNYVLKNNVKVSMCLSNDKVSEAK
jgi:hypothetical protein